MNLRDVTSYVGETVAGRPQGGPIVKVGFLADNVLYLQDEDGREFVAHFSNYVKDENGEPT